MKASRKSVLALIGAMAMGAAMAAPSVEIVSVQQQYPWTNTVDIVYNVAGVASDTNGYFVAFTPTTQAGQPIEDINGETSIQVALSCTTNGAVAQWFPQTNQQYTACKMTPAVYRGGSAGGNDYMIVDLENWTVSYEPMATQEASNEKYLADAYKTRYLVLRRIAANSAYHIGEDGNTNNIGDTPNSGHDVVIPKDYYAGIFTLTEAQWSRINDDATVSNSKLPKGYISYNEVRGNALVQATPVSGIIGKLNAKLKATGAMSSGGFDLPTRSMWEIAARAGCQTKFICGDTGSVEEGYLDYAWCSNNQGSSDGRATRNSYIHEVGLKKPNGWGLFDVTGNSWDLCRDSLHSGKDLASFATQRANGFVPLTTSDTGNSSRVMIVGGSPDWGAGSIWQRFSECCSWSRSATAFHVGIRIFWSPQN